MSTTTHDHEELDASTTTTSGDNLGAAYQVQHEPETTEASQDVATEAVLIEREPLPKDIRFDILKNQRRRLVLQYLLDNEGVAKLGPLAEHIAAFENDITVGELNSKQRKRVYVGLYQAHLPRMADAGVVEFNPSRGTIALAPNAVDVVPYLDDDTEAAGDYAPLYLALATIGAGAFLISESAGALAGFLGTLVVAFVLLASLALASWQLYTGRDDE